MKVLKIFLLVLVIAFALDFLAYIFSGNGDLMGILMKGKYLNAW